MHSAEPVQQLQRTRSGVVIFQRRFIFYGFLTAIFTLLIIDYKTPTLFLEKGFSWRKLAMIDPEKIELEEGKAPIYFLETSSKTRIPLREVCAVEAAARQHPLRNVTFFSLRDLDLDDVGLQPLFKRPNVHFSTLNLNEMFSGTPLEDWHRQSSILQSSFPVEHLSDAIRVTLLWKLGGIYLDTDVICLRPFAPDLRNALGLESGIVANGAVLLFDRAHDFLYQCMLGYVANFSGAEWSTQGPGLFTRTLHAVCGVEQLVHVLQAPDLCRGVTLLPARAFYPIPWSSWTSLFLKGRIPKAYTIHLWGKLSRNRRTWPGRGNRLDVLFRENCPSTYQLMKTNLVV